jgi:hypothetical protein
VLVATVGGSESLTVSIHNNGAATVDDIPAVTGSNRNFKLTAFYSTATTPTQAAIGAPWTPAATATDLQQTLKAAAGSKNIYGTISYPAIAPTNCPNVNFVCITVVADTANNAAYSESGTLADNTVCNDISVTCFPGKYYYLHLQMTNASSTHTSYEAERLLNAELKSIQSHFK